METKVICFLLGFVLGVALTAAFMWKKFKTPEGQAELQQVNKDLQAARDRLRALGEKL
jgi:hypothetical protein